MVKMIKLVVLISLLMVIISCSNKNDTQVNKSDLTENKAKNDTLTDTGYLKNITYSNLADKKVQNEVQEILANSEISSQNINLFFQSVNYYNKKTENKDLIKSGFVNSQNINPIYDEAKYKLVFLFQKRMENFCLLKSWHSSNLIKH